MSRSIASADVFQAIADPSRRAILDRLQQGEQSVKHLAVPFAMSLPAILQHLQVLCAGSFCLRHLDRLTLFLAASVAAADTLWEADEYRSGSSLRSLDIGGDAA